MKAKELLEAIYHNLGRGAEALNVPSLTDEATRASWGLYSRHTWFLWLIC